MHYVIVNKHHDRIETVIDAASPEAAIAALDADVGLRVDKDTWRDWLNVRPVSAELAKRLIDDEVVWWDDEFEE